MVTDLLGAQQFRQNSSPFPKRKLVCLALQHFKARKKSVFKSDRNYSIEKIARNNIWQGERESWFKLRIVMTIRESLLPSKF